MPVSDESWGCPSKAAYMEDLHWEVALRELNVLPMDSLSGQWWTPAGNGDLDIGMTKRSPSWRWMGSEPKGQTILTHCPPWPDKDIGCLKNTLATRLWLGTPHINTFIAVKATLSGTEVTFEQWYHEVQCVKDHYPKSVVWESIVRLLKGQPLAVGQTSGLVHGSHCQLLCPTYYKNQPVIFGTVASFDVLMQTFYKVTQGNHGKVPSFTTRLEGTLNQIRLQCPRRKTGQRGATASQRLSLPQGPQAY